MKQEKKSQRKGKESPLKNLVSVGNGLCLMASHSINMYQLMEQAGMYATNSAGDYTELYTPEGIVYQTTIALGSLALFAGGKLGTDLLLNRMKKSWEQLIYSGDESF